MRPGLSGKPIEVLLLPRDPEERRGLFEEDAEIRREDIKEAKAEHREAVKELKAELKVTSDPEEREHI